MLILTLRVNEAIRAGDVEIMLTGVAVRGMPLQGVQVKLGITAPEDVKIDWSRRNPKRTPSRRGKA